jgi:hypothetical protein
VKLQNVGYKAHDDAHGAFMTLPPYTRTSEDEVHSLGSGPKPCRLGLGQNTNSPFVTTTPAAGPPVLLDHFAALEQPEALVHEIRAFFKPLRP